MRGVKEFDVKTWIKNWKYEIVCELIFLQDTSDSQIYIEKIFRVGRLYTNDRAWSDEKTALTKAKDNISNSYNGLKKRVDLDTKIKNAWHKPNKYKIFLCWRLYTYWQYVYRFQRRHMSCI